MNINFALQNYQVIKPIGHGGMARVYEAIQLPMERRIALKVLLPHLTSDEQFTERFLLETKALARFSHNNIATIYDAGHEKNIYYLAMELLGGGTFSDRIAQGCSAEQILLVIRGVAQALAITHAAGVIHRDVKPDNILFHHAESYEPVLADFGIAKDASLDSGLTGVDSVIGSPAFMSPEQTLGKSLDYRSDIFSLGVVLYNGLTQKRPFTSQSLGELALAHQANVVSPLSPNLKAIQPLVDVMLEIDRDRRLITAEEVIAYIDTITGALDSTAIEPTVIRSQIPRQSNDTGSARPAGISSNRPLRIASLAVLSLALIGTVGYVARNLLELDSSSFDQWAYSDKAAEEEHPASLITRAVLDSIMKNPNYASLELTKNGQILDEAVGIASGDYEVSASAPGYESKTISISIPGNLPAIVLPLKQYIEVEEFYDYVAFINSEITATDFLARQPNSVMAKVANIKISTGDNALALLKNLATQGDPPSQLQLSEIYDYGIKVTRDNEAAIYWSSEAAKQGYALAQYQHSSLLLDNSNDPEKIDGALQTLENLADQGSFLAHNLLADIYLEGHHREKNIDLGLLHLKLSAELGDPIAMQSLKNYEN